MTYRLLRRLTKDQLIKTISPLIREVVAINELASTLSGGEKDYPMLEAMNGKSLEIWKRLRNMDDDYWKGVQGRKEWEAFFKREVL